jgi:hypothetical protein
LKYHICQTTCHDTVFTGQSHAFAMDCLKSAHTNKCTALLTAAWSFSFLFPVSSFHSYLVFDSFSCLWYKMYMDNTWISRWPNCSVCAREGLYLEEQNPLLYLSLTWQLTNYAVFEYIWNLCYATCLRHQVSRVKISKSEKINVIHNWELMGFWNLSVVRKSKVPPSPFTWGQKQIQFPKRPVIWYFRFPDDGQSAETH